MPGIREGRDINMLRSSDGPVLEKGTTPVSFLASREFPSTSLASLSPVASDTPVMSDLSVPSIVCAYEAASADQASRRASRRADAMRDRSEWLGAGSGRLPCMRNTMRVHSSQRPRSGKRMIIAFRRAFGKAASVRGREQLTEA
jgi:hypothetical protein